MKLRKTVFTVCFPADVEDADGFCALCRSETVVDRMLYNWMSICLYQFLRVTTFLSLCLFLLCLNKKYKTSSETKVSESRILVCVFQDTAGEPLYKLFKALKHQVEKGPVDAKMKKAKYTLNDTGLLGDDVEYSVLVRTGRRRQSTGVSRCNLYLRCQTLQVLVHGEGPDVTPVKVLNCDTITQVS